MAIARGGLGGAKSSIDELEGGRKMAPTAPQGVLHLAFPEFECESKPPEILPVQPALFSLEREGGFFRVLRQKQRGGQEIVAEPFHLSELKKRQV